MDKNKQIEEMAKAINIADHENCSGRCLGCEYKGMVTEGYTCVDIAIATSLTAKDYRKASDVAREIFEELEKKVKACITIYTEEINKEHIQDTPLYDRCSGSIFAFKNIEDFIGILKTKYTEDGE